MDVEVRVEVQVYRKERTLDTPTWCGVSVSPLKLLMPEFTRVNSWQRRQMIKTLDINAQQHKYSMRLDRVLWQLILMDQSKGVG